MSSAEEASTTASGTTPGTSDSSLAYGSHAARSVITFDGPSARSSSDRALSSAVAVGRIVSSGNGNTQRA